MKKKLAVMSLCFTTLLYLVLTVSVAGLLAAFPDVPEHTVMLVLTLPSLTGIAGILAVPFLTPYLSQRALSVLGLSMLFAGGVLCLLFHESLAVLLAAAGITGVAYGIISALYPLLVNANFSGAERVTVMGLCAAMLQAGRLAASLIGGYLARAHWYDVYYTYGFVLLALILVAAFLPENRTGAQRSDRRDTVSLRSGPVWMLSFFSAGFACLYFLISTDASVYIEGYGLGTSALTGWLSSVSCAAAGICAAFYGKISRVFGRYTLSFAFAAVGAGDLFAGFCVGKAGITAAFLFSALGIALFTPWLMTAISEAAGRTDAPVATAVVLTCVNVGYFVSPAVTGPVGSLLGGGSAAAFAGTGVLSLAFFVGTALLTRRRAKAGEN